MVSFMEFTVLGKKIKTNPVSVSYENKDATFRIYNLTVQLLFRHLPHHASKFCYHNIYSVLASRPVSDNQGKVASTVSQYELKLILAKLLFLDFLLFLSHTFLVFLLRP